jgi:hypothetical protein
MNVEMEIGDLVCRLSDLRAEYQGLYGHSQQQLRDYVTARQYPIAERFEVWSEWCEKVYHSCTDDNTDEAVEMREKYSVTVDDVKETLIQTNFGSFRMDH